MCRRRIQPLRVIHSTVVPATVQPDRTRFHPSLAVKKALAYFPAALFLVCFYRCTIHLLTG